MPCSENSKMLKFYYIYVLESIQHKSLYVGYTSDLRKRLDKHNKGLNKSTKYYAPYKLIYYEACLHHKDAKRREKYFKTTQGNRLLKRRLKEYFYAKKSIN